MKIWISLEDGLPELAGLPVDIEVYQGTGEPPSDPADVEFWVPPYMAATGVTSMLDRMPSLKVVQLLTAGADVWEPVMPAGVALCDAKGVHTVPTAEWVMTAILTSLRNFPRFIHQQAERRWEPARAQGLEGRNVLILGAGDIGEAVARRCEAFDANVVRVARTARDGVHGTDELPALLPNADVVVVIVPLTEATRGLVDAKFLATMRTGALLVNAARGKVVDTDALLAETTSGRLSAALDVTDPEPLPADHELWGLANVLLTPHIASSVPGFHAREHKLVAEQVRRFVAGETLENVVANGY